MSLPRPIHPGTTYLITRRCVQRAFMLRPSPEINQIFLYCLAVAAEKFGIEVHAFCVMSNHYHIVVTDTLGQLPAFMQWLNRCVAKCVNSVLGRSEAMWAQGHYSAVQLAGAEDVLAKMVYVAANPVDARLVRDSRDWPGLDSLPEDLNSSVFSASRPAVFFRKRGALPDSATLKLVTPPALAHIPHGELVSQLRTRLDTRQREIREEARRERQPFLGRQGVLDQSPLAAPTSPEKPGGSNPRVACKDARRRDDLLRRLKEFVRSYREAWKKFCAGVRDVIFPQGTYLLRLRYNVSCEPDSWNLT